MRRENDFFKLIELTNVRKQKFCGIQQNNFVDKN